MIVYEPAEAGVNDTSQYALPINSIGDVLVVVPSVQLPESANDPDVGEAEKLTDPDGVVAKIGAVSATVAVQVVALPAVPDPGAHTTLVDVG